MLAFVRVSKDYLGHDNDQINGHNLNGHVWSFCIIATGQYCPLSPSSPSLPGHSSWWNWHPFLCWPILWPQNHYSVEIRIQEGLHCGEGMFSGYRRKKTATYSHQLHGKGEGQVLHLKEEGHRFEGEVILKIFDNQYGASLTNLNSDTSWRSVQFLGLLLCVGRAFWKRTILTYTNNVSVTVQLLSSVRNLVEAV